LNKGERGRDWVGTAWLSGEMNLPYFSFLKKRREAITTNGGGVKRAKTSTITCQ